MKKSLLFLPLLGLASNVAAQELHGVVTDADNNPLVGASVYWAETTIGASTSATGAYTVHRVKNYDRLVASYLGYVNDTIRIADGVAEQNFRLRSEGVDIEGVVVESTLGGNYVKRDGILKGETISFAGLCKMACCNLAESFENSASVMSVTATPSRAHGRSRCSDWPAPIRRFSTRTAPSCAGCRPPTD